MELLLFFGYLVNDQQFIPWLGFLWPSTPISLYFLLSSENFHLNSCIAWIVYSAVWHVVNETNSWYQDPMLLVLNGMIQFWNCFTVHICCDYFTVFTFGKYITFCLLVSTFCLLSFCIWWSWMTPLHKLLFWFTIVVTHVSSRALIHKNIRGKFSEQATQAVFAKENHTKVNKWLYNKHYCCHQKLFHTPTYFSSFENWQCICHLFSGQNDTDDMIWPVINIISLPFLCAGLTVTDCSAPKGVTSKNASVN